MFLLKIKKYTFSLSIINFGPISSRSPCLSRRGSLSSGRPACGCLLLCCFCRLFLFCWRWTFLKSECHCDSTSPLTCLSCDYFRLLTLWDLRFLAFFAWFSSIRPRFFSFSLVQGSLSCINFFLSNILENEIFLYNLFEQIDARSSLYIESQILFICFTDFNKSIKIFKKLRVEHFRCFNFTFIQLI